VVAAAKRDLKAGETLDGLGGYCTYGLAERTTTARTENLLELGLVEGATLVSDVPKDQVLTEDDVRLPQGRVSDDLVRELRERFGGAAKETYG
jgi:predicted homoserine dehydrogenase-like protein